jgi:hypothetical protein
MPGRDIIIPGSGLFKKKNLVQLIFYVFLIVDVYKYKKNIILIYFKKKLL